MSFVGTLRRHLAVERGPKLKRIVIAGLSTVVLVCLGAGVAVALPGPEIDSAGMTLTMQRGDFATAKCTGEETIGSVETAKPYETLRGTWRGSSVDSMAGDTPFSLTGAFTVNNLVWTINLNPAQPHGNPYTGVLRGTALLTSHAGTVFGGPIVLITQGLPNANGSTVSARGWIVGSTNNGGSYLFNVAFRIGAGFAASGLSGNAHFNDDAWAAYDNNLTC